MQCMKLGHKVTHASWDDDKGGWQATVEDLQSGTMFVDTAEVLINYSGVLK